MLVRAVSRLVVAAVAMAASLLFVMVHGTTSAGAAPLLPAGNIAPSPAYPSACSTAPTGSTCVNSAISALQRARKIMGLAPYSIPAGFGSLPASIQLFELSQQDRSAYGLQRMKGLNPTLNSAALSGVLQSVDPMGVTSILGYGFRYWASNWAAGYKSPLYTYYEWMYNDGPGGTNADCQHPSDAGCWGHRKNTLKNFGSGVQIVMGAASGGSPLYGGVMSFTELYESFPATAPIPTVAAVMSIRRLDTTHVYVAASGLSGVTGVKVGSTSVRWWIKSATGMVVQVPRGTTRQQLQVLTTGGASALTSLSLFQLV